jgi:hypothetical protein
MAIYMYLGLDSRIQQTLELTVAQNVGTNEIF